MLQCLNQSLCSSLVLPESKVVPKPVQASSWIGGDVIITGGLNEGDLVIVDNLVKLRPGAVVQPQQAPAKAAAR